MSSNIGTVEEEDLEETKHAPQSLDNTFDRCDSIDISNEDIQNKNLSDLVAPSHESKVEFRAFETRGTIKEEHIKASEPQPEEGVCETIRQSKSDIDDEFYVNSDKEEMHSINESCQNNISRERPFGNSSPLSKQQMDDLSDDSDPQPEPERVVKEIFESPKRRRKNVIIESDEKNKLHILSTDLNFISINMSSEKKECNIQSFEQKYDETQMTSF